MAYKKYKVGDRVKIQSLEQYNKYKNRYGVINYGDEDEILFTSEMSSFCGQVVTISQVRYIGGIRFYHLAEDKGLHLWLGGMFEGLVEEETKPELKFKVGDKVLIKSLDWYNENKDADSCVHCGDKVFDNYMSVFCGSIVTIGGVCPYGYDIIEDMHCRTWTDEMIECKVEEETKPNVIEEAKTYWDSIKDAWICPDGYIFKDENGNVINATKIVLEKKKKEYPKTYDECCKVLGYVDRETFCISHTGADERLFENLYCLKVCRDAYWKIAGEEMGLGKPWEPDYKNEYQKKYCIYNNKGDITKSVLYIAKAILSFPTEEMRDAFYDNFKSEIEICKELL